MFTKTSTHKVGFTLIEILMVVIILGIAAAVIVPQISSRDDLRAAAAARVVMSDLIYAQNMAITTQKRHYVKFDAATYRLQTRASDSSPFTDISHPIYKTPDYVVTFGSGGQSGLKDVTLVSADFSDQTTIVFDELGAPYAYAAGANTTSSLTGRGQITLGSGTFQLSIYVEQDTGEINVE